MTNKIILASSSIYRQGLLKRFVADFSSIAPAIDESKIGHETPAEYVQRLSQQKAQVVSELHPSAWVIGSDQAAVFAGEIVGKPYTHDTAVEQLSRFSGKRVSFLTGVCLRQADTSHLDYRLVETQVDFKPLTSAKIERYLLLDTPYDCAGSFKVESRATALFEKVTSDDPTALEGLPLIALNQMLEAAGIDLLAN